MDARAPARRVGQSSLGGGSQRLRIPGSRGFAREARHAQRAGAVEDGEDVSLEVPAVMRRRPELARRRVIVRRLPVMPRGGSHTSLRGATGLGGDAACQSPRPIEIVQFSESSNQQISSFIRSNEGSPNGPRGRSSPRRTRRFFYTSAERKRRSGIPTRAILLPGWAYAYPSVHNRSF